MNRPRKEDYMNDSYAYDCEYPKDLEKYCDELEKSQHNMFIELCEYKKALDKACEQLSYSIKAITKNGRIWTSEEWKEWCLKDELWRVDITCVK